MRCALHDLAAAPDGQCVLCRRAAAHRAPLEPWVVVGGVAAVLGACIVYRAESSWTSRAVEVAPATSMVAHGAGDDTASQTMPRPDVVVYTTRWCSVCRRAKKWMSEQGIAYEERDVEASPENARRMRAINPRGSVPTFDLDGRVLVGFSEPALASALRHASTHQ